MADFMFYNDFNIGTCMTVAGNELKNYIIIYMNISSTKNLFKLQAFMSKEQTC